MDKNNGIHKRIAITAYKIKKTDHAKFIVSKIIFTYTFFFSYKQLSCLAPKLKFGQKITAKQLPRLRFSKVKNYALKQLFFKSQNEFPKTRPSSNYIKTCKLQK